MNKENILKRLKKMNRYSGMKDIAKEDGEDIVFIHYPFRWGRQFADKSFWCAVHWKTQEVYDYHLKEHLKKDLTKKGYKWIIVRHHAKNRGVSVLEKSSHFNDKENKEVKK